MSRITAALSFKDQLFPLGTKPPVEVLLTLVQGQTVVYTEAFPVAAEMSQIATDAPGVPNGDFVLRLQARDADGSLVGDGDSRSITLPIETVALPVPTLGEVTIS